MSFRLLAALGATALAATLAGCSSGSGGSDVGSHTPTPPTARIEVVNGGATQTFREGAEVLLSGKASEDSDGPPIAWSWRQTSGPPVQLLEINTTAVKFTAPPVESPTNLELELTVTDSTGNRGSATTNVQVLPARDANKFLSLDVARGASFDTFELVAALAGGASTGQRPPPFTLAVTAYLVYPPRSAPSADCGFDAADFAGGAPRLTARGCAVEPLEDLTPEPLLAGGTGRAGEWPAGIVAPDEPDALRITRWWNPRFTLRVPRLVVHEFNQRFVDAGERSRMLDAFAAHNARIVLSLRLTAPENQPDATLVFPALVHSQAPLPSSSPGPQTPAGIANAGGGLPTAAFVPLDAVLAAIEGREAALTSAVYYRTVDPTGTRRTLNAWLRQAGFVAADGTLLPEAVAGTGEFAHAVYVNNFDLGFGRQMYTRTDALGNVFSFVKNYATLEGAIRQLDSFATVVTEYSPLASHTDSTPRFVKFFTYVEDGSGDAPLVASFDFDGRGERFTPGNCVVCHGGQRPPGVSELVFDATCGERDSPACYAWPARNRDGAAVPAGDLGGTFLPWDLGSLLFADTDPAITQSPLRFDGVTLATELRRDHGDFSRGAQLSQIKKLNQAAYDTYTDRNDAARRLVESWYSGVDASGRLVSGAFDDSATVPGWRNGELVPDPSPTNPGGSLTNPPTTEALYHDVYARHCRMCHTSMPDGPLRFDTYQELISQLELVRSTVFRSGTMPGARLTMDRFWVPFEGGTPPGELLAEHMASVRAAPPDGRPGPPVAAISGLEPAPRRSDVVYLDGGGSAFAETFSWSLTAPPGSAARLSSASAPQAAFVPDIPGTYEITLTVGAGSQQAATTESVTLGNRAPIAVNDMFDLNLAITTALTGSVLAPPHQDADPDGDSLLAALAAAPQYGAATIGANGAFTYAYTANLATPPDSDTFRYRIADAYGGTAEGTVRVLLNDAAVASRPTPVAQFTAAAASTAAGAASSFAVRLGWLASSDDVQVQGYNVYRDGTPLAFVPSTAAAGTALSYIDSSVSPGMAYAYRVTAVDASSESTLSAERVATVATSLRQNIQTGWGAGADTLWRESGCVGCHRGPAGGLTLFGEPEQVAAELREDSADAAPRRAEIAAPLRSLLLCKPLIKSDPASCPHEGGAFFVRSDPQFQTLLRWIESGAPNN